MHEMEREQARRYPGLTVSRDGEAVVVHIPLRFHRRNGKMMVVTEHANSEILQPGEANQSLLDAIAKAHKWQEDLEAGNYAGIEDMARELKLDRSYLTRMLRLTSLAPEIVARIVKNDEPDGISLRSLHKELPLSWEEQRRKWVSN